MLENYSRDSSLVQKLCFDLCAQKVSSGSRYKNSSSFHLGHLKVFSLGYALPIVLRVGGRSLLPLKCLHMHVVVYAILINVGMASSQ